jgi:hypothetical protein
MNWLTQAFGQGAPLSGEWPPQGREPLPEPLEALLCLGPAAFGGGIFCTIDARSWGHDPEAPGLVFAHSAFGNLFSLDDEVIETDGESGRTVKLGPLDGFMINFLFGGFIDGVLERKKFAKIRARLGDLSPGQMFLPAPLPALGGSGRPKTYVVSGLREGREIMRQVR